MNSSLATVNVVRLQDIAERACVSRATVSLALRDHPSISTGTRSRIRKIADLLAYRPNPLVSALMKYQRTAKAPRKMDVTLAVVFQSRRQEAQHPGILQDILHAIHRHAGQHGYRAEEFWLEDLGMSVARLDRILYHRAIPGVIVIPFAGSTNELALNWSRLSGVAIGTTLNYPRIDRVDLDCFEAIHLAVMRLRELGYQRIGFAMKNENRTGLLRHFGAAYLVEQQNLPAADRLAPFLTPNDGWTEKNFPKWYDAEQPDVILGHAAEVLPWLERLGKRVPQQVGFAELSITEYPNRWSGIEGNSSAIGRAAVDLLVELVESNKYGVPDSPKTVLLQSSWVEGNSTRRVHERPTY